MGDYQHPHFKERTDAAIAFGGPSALISLLRSVLVDLSASDLSAPHRVTLLRIAAHCLMSVRELTYSVHTLAYGLLGDIDSLSIMFQFLRWSLCFNAATAALEEVLSFRPHMLQLSDVDNIDVILSGFQAHQLALFCRVLSLLVYEPERHDPASACRAPFRDVLSFVCVRLSVILSFCQSVILSFCHSVILSFCLCVSDMRASPPPARSPHARAHAARESAASTAHSQRH